MGRFICIVKNYTWGRLIPVGKVLELPVGTKLPNGNVMDGAGKVKRKVPYFKMIAPGKKSKSGVQKKLDAKGIKTIRNKLTSLYARTNLTKAEEAEKVRLLDRLAEIDEATSPEERISRAEIAKNKADAVSSAQGAAPMSMAETQAMKHKQAAEARNGTEEETEQSTLVLDAPEVVEGDPEAGKNKE